jgi:hypothetical protein
MNVSKNWIPVICLIVSLVFSATALITPWWSIRTSKALQITGNTTKNANYMPFQTVTAVDTGMNKSIVISFKELNASETDIDRLASLFKTAVILTTVGIALTILALALTVLSIVRKHLFSYLWIIAMIGGIVLFIVPLFLATEVQPILTKFNNVLPSDISVVSGSGIADFWGNNQSWAWGAGFGWFMLFTASLICLVAAVLTRTILKRTD